MLSAPTSERHADTAMDSAAAELEERADSDRTWQKATLFGGVFARLSMVRKDIVKDSLMTPLPTKLPPPDAAALRIQRAERGRATRKRAHDALHKARNKSAVSRAQPAPAATAPLKAVSSSIDASDVEKQSTVDLIEASDENDQGLGVPTWLPLVLGSVAIIGLSAVIALVVHITNNPEAFFARRS